MLLTDRQHATLDRMNPQTKVVAARGTVVVIRTTRGSLIAVTASGNTRYLGSTVRSAGQR